MESSHNCSTALRVFCIGDFGHPNPTIASCMAKYAAQNGAPNFILGLGDNFYPNGVSSVDDEKFNTHWRDIYLPHADLRCPWYMVLGNHDYRQNPDAQIAYSSSSHNVDNIWRLPGRNYQFSAGPVTFFALDTNGCQGEVRYLYPQSKEDLRGYIKQLDTDLQAAPSSQLKIVFGHHPMYTRGAKHSILGQCLRNAEYTYNNSYAAGDTRAGRGYSLEKVLAANDVRLYITGHEHVLQYHEAEGVHSFVCGASCEHKFYGGEDPEQPMTWQDTSGSTGFLALEITNEGDVFARFVSQGPAGEDGEPTILFEKFIARNNT